MLKDHKLLWNFHSHAELQQLKRQPFKMRTAKASCLFSNTNSCYGKCTQAPPFPRQLVWLWSFNLEDFSSVCLAWWFMGCCEVRKLHSLCNRVAKSPLATSSRGWWEGNQNGSPQDTIKFKNDFSVYRSCLLIWSKEQKWAQETSGQATLCPSDCT